MTLSMMLAVRGRALRWSLLVLAGCVVPIAVCAQQPHWVTQIEAHLGAWIPAGYEVPATNAGGEPVAAELKSSLAFGLQASFPVATWPGKGGKLSIGAQGFFVPGAEMRVVTTGAALGSADYYQVSATVSAGEFVAALPITATLVPLLGVGVGHTTLDPDAGVLFADGNRSTALVLTGALGLDFLLAPSLSIVTQAGANLGIRGTSDGTAAEWSFSILGGIAIRLPFGGKPSP